MVALLRLADEYQIGRVTRFCEQWLCGANERPVKLLAYADQFRLSRLLVRSCRSIN